MFFIVNLLVRRVEVQGAYPISLSLLSLERGRSGTELLIGPNPVIVVDLIEASDNTGALQLNFRFPRMAGDRREFHVRRACRDQSPFNAVMKLLMKGKPSRSDAIHQAVWHCQCAAK